MSDKPYSNNQSDRAQIDHKLNNAQKQLNAYTQANCVQIIKSKYQINNNNNLFLQQFDKKIQILKQNKQSCDKKKQSQSIFSPFSKVKQQPNLQSYNSFIKNNQQSSKDLVQKSSQIDKKIKNKIQNQQSIAIKSCQHDDTNLMIRSELSQKLNQNVQNANKLDKNLKKEINKGTKNQKLRIDVPYDQLMTLLKCQKQEYLQESARNILANKSLPSSKFNIKLIYSCPVFIIDRKQKKSRQSKQKSYQ